MDCVTSISQKHQADVLVANRVDNTPGAVFGTAVYRSMDLRLVPSAVPYLPVQSSREEKLRSGFQWLIICAKLKKSV